jgi:hypothetical protein
MITGAQPKILLTQTEDGTLKMDDEMGKLLFGGHEMNWKLVRERDGLTKQSEEVMWLEFNKNGTFKSKHKTPAVGRSLIMSPFNEFFIWQTTTITEIVEQRDNYIKFKTENSNYELFKYESNN